MKNLLNPKWILLSCTLPVFILLLIGWGEFTIIKSLLSYESKSLLKTFVSILVFLTLCNTAYSIIQTLNKKKIDIAYCAITLVIQIAYLYSYLSFSDDIFPSDIPQWMGSGNLHIYVGTFLMPSLIHSLFTLVVLLDGNRNVAGWKAVLCAIITVLLFFVFSIIIVPLWNGIESVFSHIFLLTIMLFTAIFLFFLIRGIYRIMTYRSFYANNELLLKILISTVLPLFSLLLNDYVFPHLFGDFSNIWFYLIAGINGLLICMPSPQKPIYRLLLFAGKCITLIYTTYFFLVFIPFLPFSLFAIILFGLGFLMLTPLLLFVIHINEIGSDFSYLKKYYKPVYLHLTFICGLLVLPASITINYIYDRKMLHKTLDYIYSADYSIDYKFNAGSALKTIRTIDESAGESDFLYSSTPFLSSYFKWIVLDNLNLSDSRKQLIRNLCSGSKTTDSSSINNSPNGQNNIRVPDIKITGIEHTSKYDGNQKAWTSRIDLHITNGNTELWDSEYKTLIDLPTGCWISDYYLYVGDTKETGMLTEKKAATWVFNQIRSINRDPGLLRYVSGNTVEFKVFPFNKNETRKTGIEFIHKEPVSLNIGGNILALGNDKDIIPDNFNREKKEVMYISAKEKEELETVKRTPYYHFIADISSNENYNINQGKGTSLTERYIRQIETLLDKGLIASNNSKISYTNIYVTTSALDTNWKDELRNQHLEGGFFLDRAIRKILFENYINPKDSYPVIIVLSDNLNKAVMLENLADMQFAYPENNKFYSLTNNSLNVHSFSSGLVIVKENVDTLPVCKVKAWPSVFKPIAYLPDDNKASIVLNTKNKALNFSSDNISDKSWVSGLHMQAQWMMQILYPETADTEWLNLVYNSFKARIMTPLTSYIVVENEAEKEALKKKQIETLNGKRALDINEETQQMSEPDLIIVVIFFGLFYLMYKRKFKRTEH